MGKQANIRNVSIIAHMDGRGKSMLIDSLVGKAGIITESLNEALDAETGCVDRCITLKSSYNV